MPNSDSPQGGGGGLYAPLSQNLTDSESEEEILNSNRHPQNIKSNKFSSVIGEGTEITMHNHITSDGEEHNGFIGLYSDADNVAILHKTVEPMSPLRKCCFVISLQVCILTVVLFIWILPCSDNLTCPAPSERLKTHRWIREYEKVELKGMINIVDGIRGRSKNLVFMYRGDKIFPDKKELQPKRSGIICLVGSVGEVAWYDEMIHEPSSIDCSLIDADKDGFNDCLITDEYGQLGCINPISGTWIWHVHNSENSSKKGDLLDFPLVLPDLNKDGVSELLLASSMGGIQHNNLIIISGANGLLFGRPFAITECRYIHKLQIDIKFTISFNCVNRNSELEKFKPFSELYNAVSNLTLDVQNLPFSASEQHKFFGQRKNTESQRNIYSVSGKQLIVENRGKCPENCNVTVFLYDEKNSKDYMQIITSNLMYGMVPSKLSFNKSSKKYGFVMKFWEWNQNETEYKYKSDRLKRSTDEEFNIFSKYLIRKKRWVLPKKFDDNKSRKSRDVKDNYTNNFLKSKMRLIKETIVLIVFNSTETRIVNTSQSNIIQFCREENGTSFCQPDLNYQENSLLVADLDNDGSQELVSYYSTFVSSDDTDNDWKLITYVQLLRLESDLPKLYADFKN